MGWSIIYPDTCDMCLKQAWFVHKKGGRRCAEHLPIGNDVKPPKRAKGVELKILLNIGMELYVEYNQRVSLARVHTALVNCFMYGWLTNPGDPKLTDAGRQAASLVLKEVPLPPHLAALAQPRKVAHAGRKEQTPRTHTKERRNHRRT